MKGKVTRILGMVLDGLFVLETLFVGIFGLMGVSMLIYPYLKDGIDYYLERMPALFAANKGDFFIGIYSSIFDEYMEIVSPDHPWIHVFVLILSIINLVQLGKLFRNFIKNFRNKNNKTIPKTTIPVNNRPEKFDMPKKGSNPVQSNLDDRVRVESNQETIDSTETIGMPSVLARHHRRTRKE